MLEGYTPLRLQAARLGSKARPISSPFPEAAGETTFVGWAGSRAGGQLRTNRVCNISLFRVEKPSFAFSGPGHTIGFCQQLYLQQMRLERVAAACVLALSIIALCMGNLRHSRAAARTVSIPDAAHDSPFYRDASDFPACEPSIAAETGPLFGARDHRDWQY